MRTNSIDEGRLSPQAAAVFARAEKFRSKTLEPEAFTWEFVDRRANSAALREAARLGLTGIEVDKAVGGLGLGFREKVRIAEILCRSSMSFAFSLLNSQNVAARIAARGTDEQRSEFLPGLLSGRRFGATALTEPHAGSDFAAIKTSAVKMSTGWVLNGQKAWITNGAIADVILCYAQTDVSRGRDGIACFLIDGRRTGFESEPAYTLTAGSAVGVAGFSLNNYEATDLDMLVVPGEGFRHALAGVNGARIYVAAMACAMVRSALAEAVDYGTTRQTFGRPLLDHQGLRWSLAEVANQLEAAEALTGYAVDVHEKPTSAEADDPIDIAIAAAHAKKFATEILEPSLRACMQAMGAEGLRSGNRVGRLVSEARIVSYVDGTTEMQTERIGRSLATEYGGESLEPASVAYRIVTEVEDELAGPDVIEEVAESDMGDPATEVTAPPSEEIGDESDARSDDEPEPVIADQLEPESVDDHIGDAPNLFGNVDVVDEPVDNSIDADDNVESTPFFGREAENASQIAAAAVTAATPPMPPMPPPAMQIDTSGDSLLAPFETAEGLAVGFDQNRFVPPMPPVDIAPPPDGPPLPPPSTMLPPPASPPMPPPASPPMPPPASPPMPIAATAPPPLPPDEHRLDLTTDVTTDDTTEEDLQPSAPPLPPESLRQGD